MMPARHLGMKEETWRYSRISGSKENYAPPADQATWFKLESVPLGNGTELYPDGDNIQVTVSWKPEGTFEGMDYAVLSEIFKEIRKGPAPDRLYAAARNATHWAGTPIVQIADKTRAQADAILKRWLQNRVLVEVQLTENKKPSTRVTVNEVSAAEILATFGPPPADD